MANDPMIQNNAISFGEKLVASANFKALFADGMALVEETAAYLDGEGREDARRLPRTVALAYASESMRLTTRLMQIASWLLLQRAVNEGEMTQAEASSDKHRTRVCWQTASQAIVPSATLPVRLVTLIETSRRLQERIARLDGLIDGPVPPLALTPAPNPLEHQMSKLRDAFCS